jgi:uncharacterized membrane protein
MTEPTTPPKTSAWVKVVLALSLAFNLAILGVVAGAVMKDGQGERGVPRDLSFGPFSEALSREDKRALRSAFLDKAPEFRAGRREAQAEFTTLLTALRADPFDPAAFQSALGAIEKRNADRLALGRTLIENRIILLSVEDRLAFADRLEAALSRDGRKAP